MRKRYQLDWEQGCIQQQPLRCNWIGGTVIFYNQSQCTRTFLLLISVLFSSFPLLPSLQRVQEGTVKNLRMAWSLLIMVEKNGSLKKLLLGHELGFWVICGALIAFVHRSQRFFHLWITCQNPKQLEGFPCWNFTLGGYSHAHHFKIFDNLLSMSMFFEWLS